MLSYGVKTSWANFKLIENHSKLANITCDGVFASVDNSSSSLQ